MNSRQAESQHETSVDPADEVENGIRDFVRNDIAYLRRPGSQAEQTAAQPPQVPQPQGQQQSPVDVVVGSVVQRVAQNTLAQIETLIDELTEMRDTLRAEGERVQRELAGYAQLSQAADQSTRTISDQVAAWKRSIDGIRRD